MDTETILKIAALSIGCILLLTNFVRIDSILARILPKKNVAPKNNNVVDNSSDDEKFLHIINLWYQLKDNCNDYGLKLAVEKLDEVFPLLNNRKVEESNG